MTSFDLAHRILSQVWNISESTALSYLPLVAQVLKGKELSFSDIKEKRIDLHAKTRTLIARQYSNTENAFIINSKQDVENADAGSMAILRVNGVIQRESDVCNKGLEQYAQELEQAGQNPNIEGVLLEVHSGGGTAFGGEAFAKIVKNFEKTYKKPLASVIAHQAASAAYEIIAFSPKIFVDGETAQAGSIGTMTTLMNYKKYLENEGLEEIIVRASDSFNKNESYYQAMNGNTEPLVEEILNPLNKAFQKLVKQGRKGKLNLDKTVENPETGKVVPEVLTGKVYFGRDIIKMGLADELGSRKDALKYLKKRSKQMNQSSEKSKTKKAMFEIMNKEKAELSEHLVQLNEKLSQEEISQEEKTALEKEKNLVNNVIEMKAQAEENAELKNQITEMTEKLSELSQLQSNLENVSQELKTIKVTLDSSEQSIKQHEEKAVEFENQIKAISEEKAALEKKSNAFEDFINSKYGTDASQKIISQGSTEIEQPEPIEQKKPLTRAQQKQKIVMSSKEIAERMTKKK